MGVFVLYWYTVVKVFCNKSFISPINFPKFGENVKRKICQINHYRL